jgi:DNA-binding NarL/FixJ family response regulator
MEELITLSAKEHPDLVILDINLKGKNSLDKLEQFKLRFPAVKVIVFSSYNNEKLIIKAMDLQADGYVLKDAVYSEWMDALEAVFTSKKYLSKDLKTKHVLDFQESLKPDSFSMKIELSPQEKRIVHCIVEGMKEQEIGEHLHISKNTVHTHKKNILKKLDLHSNAELVKFAYDNQMVIK